jgi:Flp pilus assembly protein TadG
MKKERGYSLLVVAMLIPVLIAATGLSVDLGRIYVSKTEVQHFTDAAAIAAAFELDGTAQGITDATSAGTNGPGSTTTRNRWSFSTASLTSTSVQFATSPTGAWSTTPGSPANHRFVKVTTTASVPVYFLRVLSGVSPTQTLTVTAVAGQALENVLGPGLAPFSPDAHDPTRSDFGFTVGQKYTLKWAPTGQRNKGQYCQGDKGGFEPGGGDSDRGYIDVGQGDGNFGLYDAIVNGGYYLPQPLVIGSTINHVQGNKHVGPAVDERYHQDTDPTNSTLATYTGNGRRLMVVPVNDGGGPGTVVGFALFMIAHDACDPGNVKPCCGTYLSNSPVMYSDKGGAGSGGLYRVKLFS